MKIAKKHKLYQEIVNSPFSDRLQATTLDLGIVVLLLVNAKTNTIDRIALSDTEYAVGAVRVSAVPFHEIKIPVDSPENAIAQAIRTGKHILLDDWHQLFAPVFTANQARLNQQAASIESSLVWPLPVAHGGAMIFSFYQPLQNITNEHISFAEGYALRVTEQLKQLSRD